MPSPELLEDRIEQLERHTTMADVMRGMPEPMRVEVEVGDKSDSVLQVRIPGETGSEELPPDLFLFPFGNLLSKKKSPQLMVRAELTQLALADARGEAPRDMLAVSQNGQGGRGFSLGRNGRSEIMTPDAEGWYDMTGITDRIHGVVTRYRPDGAIGTVNGHSIGAELGLQYVLRRYAEVQGMNITGAVRHIKRRPWLQLLPDLLDSSPEFSSQIAGSNLQVLMAHYGVTDTKHPKFPKGSISWAAWAALSADNRAYRHWLATDGFNLDLSMALAEQPNLTAWAEHGACKLEMPDPERQKEAAASLVERFGKRLIYDVSESDHGRADVVTTYVRTLYHRTVALLDAA